MPETSDHTSYNGHERRREGLRPIRCPLCHRRLCESDGEVRVRCRHCRVSFTAHADGQVTLHDPAPKCPRSPRRVPA